MAADEGPTPENQSRVTKRADTQPAPRRTSVKQVEANRRNAKNSTGPKTAAGKHASRFNALRHGLRAREIIVPGQEDPADFEALLRELCDDWAPEGHTELLLVEQIGVAEWRLRRVRCAELGEIRNQMASRIASEASKVEEEIEDAFRSVYRDLRKTHAKGSPICGKQSKTHSRNSKRGYRLRGNLLKSRAPFWRRTREPRHDAQALVRRRNTGGERGGTE